MEQANKRASLKRSIGQGTLWQFAGAGWHFVVHLGGSAVLARALSTRDYGMMGMALLVHGLVSRVGHTGMGTGIISKTDISQEELSTAFWMGAIVHGTLCLITLAIAPFAELFFDKDAEGITQILYVLAFTFILTATGSVHGTILRKQLRFGLLKIIDGTGILIQTGTAIILAVFFDFGYWSLVGGLLFSNFITVAMKIFTTRWVPSLHFDRKSFQYIFRYGIHGLGTSMVQYLQNNVDYLLVGKLLGTSMLGIYGFAYRIPFILLNQLANPIGHVLFPALATVQNSNEQLADAFLKVAKYIALITLPMLAGLACLAQPTIVVLWSSKWLQATTPMQMLCFGAAIKCILIGHGSIFFCRNRPDLPFKFSVMETILTASAVIVFGSIYGINGVASGMVFGALLQVVSACYALHLVQASPMLLLRTLQPPVVSTVGCVVMTLVARTIGESMAFSPIVVLLVAVPTGILGYFSIMATCYRQELVGVVGIVKTTLNFGGRSSSKG